MPRYIYPWQDPHRHINETISSWKRQLQDQDEHTLGNVETSVYENRHSYDDLRANSTAAKHKQVDAKDITRLMKRKRQRNKYWGQRSLSSQTYHVGTEPISEQVVSSSHEAPRQHDNENVALVSSSVVDQPSTLLQTQKATEDLRSAIDSLRTKLDTLQPEGLRPCDITAVPEHEAVNVQDDGTVLALRKTPPDDSEMLLSQVATSQRSIYLWEEIHTLIEALISSEDDLVALATAAISELGLERLDDTVLHQVCVNEIFNQVQDDHNTAEGADVDENPMPGHTKATQLSYQVSTTLLRVLFFKKSQQPSIAEPAQAFLKLYCPSALEGLSLKTGRSETPDAGSEPLRLSNPKLIQLLMTWIIRQGPTCPDVESLQALRQFCAMKLEVKMAKGLVVKLDAVIKKKSTQ
ncbi:hypothetical protein EDD11_005101 [Mortierella claussenii]|nr:hypothetical protein EDD11_005101 [Mortierella claussenii]